MSRRLARETAVQVMFQVDMVKAEPDQALDYASTEFAVPEASKDFARYLVTGTLANLAEIDKTIQSVAKGWDLSRMANVDRNILRLAAFELLYCPDIPGSATVNEAIEIAKAYSGEEAGKFINGILDALMAKAGKSKGVNDREIQVESITDMEPHGTTLQADVEPVVKGDL